MCANRRASPIRCSGWLRWRRRYSAMAVSRAMLRLLRLRSMEEDRHRMALETSLRELRVLEGAREAAVVRERQGRDLVGKSTRSGELTDRMAGLVETAAG